MFTCTLIALDLKHQLPSCDRLKLVFGQPGDSSGEHFQGEISQANVFAAALNESHISIMGSNCSVDQLVGDMFAWPVSDSYLMGEVSVVTPALCGRSQCPPGFHGAYCDLETGNDARLTVASSLLTLICDPPARNESQLLPVHFWGTATFPKGVPYIDFGFSTKSVSPVFSASDKRRLLHTHKVYTCH